MLEPTKTANWVGFGLQPVVKLDAFQVGLRFEYLSDDGPLAHRFFANPPTATGAPRIPTTKLGPGPSASRRATPSPARCCCARNSASMARTRKSSGRQEDSDLLGSARRTCSETQPVVVETRSGSLELERGLDYVGVFPDLLRQGQHVGTRPLVLCGDQGTRDQDAQSE